MTGISRGGYLTCIIAGLDDRLRAAGAAPAWRWTRRRRAELERPTPPLVLLGQPDEGRLVVVADGAGVTPEVDHHGLAAQALERQRVGALPGDHAGQLRGRLAERFSHLARRQVDRPQAERLVPGPDRERPVVRLECRPAAARPSALHPVLPGAAGRTRTCLPGSSSSAPCARPGPRTG
ncbi:MAG: hypothetical protein J2P46_07670 [Zavarzinella sp.]|nr:hypothetical protein [Zavarzinella sp.]